MSERSERIGWGGVWCGGGPRWMKGERTWFETAKPSRNPESRFAPFGRQ
ncbi:MAG TPA: hypothetical protein VFJ06_12820 [Halococcus sp.]|nr:hypothetical protein [Halococcus sp.]